MEGYDSLVLILDGKSFETDEMVIVLGVTVDGRKIPLGFVQTGAENEKINNIIHIARFIRSARR